MTFFLWRSSKTRRSWNSFPSKVLTVTFFDASESNTLVLVLVILLSSVFIVVTVYLGGALMIKLRTDRLIEEEQRRANAAMAIAFSQPVNYSDRAEPLFPPPVATTPTFRRPPMTDSSPLVIHMHFRRWEWQSSAYSDKSLLIQRNKRKLFFIIFLYISLNLMRVSFSHLTR